MNRQKDTLVKFFTRFIQRKQKTIEDVPVDIRAAVKERLENSKEYEPREGEVDNTTE